MLDGNLPLISLFEQSSGPPTAPLIANLQLGNAMAGNGVLLPNFYQRTNLLCQVTFFDPVTLQQVDPDSGTVSVTAVAPDGSSPALTATRIGVGTYITTPFLAQLGLYQLTFSGSRSGEVTTIEGSWNSVPPLQSTTPAQTAQTWVFVNASASPYQTVPISPNVAVDLRQGVVAFQFWPNPSDGDELSVKDWYGLDGTTSSGRGQPGGPIQASSAGGITFELPGSPGTYVTSGNIAIAGFAGTWKYSLQQNAWGLKDQS